MAKGNFLTGGIFVDGETPVLKSDVEQRATSYREAMQNTLPYGDIQGYNERSTQNEKDWSNFRSTLKNYTPAAYPQASKNFEDRAKELGNKIQNIDKPSHVILHWTASQLRQLNSGEIMKDASGNPIEKTTKNFIPAMYVGRVKKPDGTTTNVRNSIHYFQEGATGENPQIIQTLPDNKKAGHVLGAYDDKGKRNLFSPEKVKDFTIFPTDVSNKNSLGIEVIYDPTIAGTGLSKQAENQLAFFIIDKMIEHKLSPKDVFSHNEIQKKGDKGEMIDFMKKFRTNLPTYLELYKKERKIGQ